MEPNFSLLGSLVKNQIVVILHVTKKIPKTLNRASMFIRLSDMNDTSFKIFLTENYFFYIIVCRNVNTNLNATNHCVNTILLSLTWIIMSNTVSRGIFSAWCISTKSNIVVFIGKIRVFGYFCGWKFNNFSYDQISFMF